MINIKLVLINANLDCTKSASKGFFILEQSLSEFVYKPFPNAFGIISRGGLCGILFPYSI